MPYDKEKMREYQRQRRKGAPVEAPAGKGEEAPITNANTIITPGVYEAGHTHTWTRKLGEETAKCYECGEEVAWQGKLLTRATDGIPDLTQSIQHMPQQVIDSWLGDKRGINDSSKKVMRDPP